MIALAMVCSMVPMIIALSYWNYEMEYDEALLDNDGMLLLREMLSDIGFALSNLDRIYMRERMEENLAQE
jgi:hypothetical protein